MVNRVLDHLEEWLITFLIGAATLIIFVAVVHRYTTGFATGGFQDALLKIDLSWAQELTIFMFVWMAKFGAAYGVRTGIHVGVDVLINALNDRTRGWFVLFGLLAGATLHRHHRQLRRALRLGTDAHGAGVGRPGTAQVDRLCLHPVGIVPDVLSLPAGGVELPQDGASAARRSRPCRRPRQGRRDRVGQAADGPASR